MEVLFGISSANRSKCVGAPPRSGLDRIGVQVYLRYPLSGEAGISDGTCVAGVNQSRDVITTHPPLLTPSYRLCTQRG